MKFPPSVLLPDMRVAHLAISVPSPTPGRILPANPNRVCVLFWPTSGGSYLVGPAGLVTTARGWSVTSGGNVSSWDFATFGHIITGEWYAVGSAAPVATYVSELTYAPIGD